MSHQFQIVFQSLESCYNYWGYPSYYYKKIKLFNFKLDPEIALRIIENYGEDMTLCLAEFLSHVRHDSDVGSAIEEVSKLAEDQLREKIKQVSSENSYLKSLKQDLEKKISELSESKASKEVAKLQDKINQLERDLGHSKNENSQLSHKLLNKRNLINQYKESDTKYHNLVREWKCLVPKYKALQKQVDDIHHIERENDKLKKSKQTVEERVQAIEQELQEAQQKLSVATTRLRGLNVNPNLAGGSSRSDQLKNEFSYIKMGLFHEASSKVLNGWRNQGSKLTFRSEEFSKIKSILSARVFCGGMAYFAKDKAEIDVELHLIMEALSSIGDFSPTPAIFQEIQEKVQAGLLHFKGVDNSDEALMKYVEETTQLITQDLQQIANLVTTEEALGEIRKFVESGLRLVRDIVNDPNSGEIYMPKNGDTFDENLHDTKDDHRGQIKLTICAGYRILGNILVKADVITHEPKPLPKESNSSLVVNQPTDLQNSQEEGYRQDSEAIEDKAIESEGHRDPEVPSLRKGLSGSNSTESQPSSLTDLPQNIDRKLKVIALSPMNSNRGSDESK